MKTGARLSELTRASDHRKNKRYLPCTRIAGSRISPSRKSKAINDTCGAETRKDKCDAEKRILFPS